MASRLAAVLAVLAGVTLVIAPAAAACRVDMALDRLVYSPGDLARVTGYASGPGAESAVEVRFSWGETGPALGAARVAADASITFEFRIPPDTAPGRYALYAHAFNAAGEVISPLPGSVPFEVPAAALPADSEAGAPAPDAEARPVSVARPLVGTAPRSSTRVRRAHAKTPLPAPRPLASRPRAAGSVAVVTPGRRAERGAPPASRAAPAGVLSPSRPRVVEAPASPQARLAPVRPTTEARVARPDPPSARPVPRAPVARPAPEERFPLAVLATILLAGCASLLATLVLLRRGRERRQQHDLQLELELQEMIVEERARAAARIPA